MSAVLKSVEARLEAMTSAWLDDVVQLETSAYEHPWSRLNFADSVNAGYQAQLLVAGDVDAELLGYFVAMKGLDEVHLLNITVAPAYQRQGWARLMLDALSLWSRAQGADWLWLEVRLSNTRAKTIYERYGFRHVGTRRNYYPRAAGRREDAIVMSLPLLPERLAR